MPTRSYDVGDAALTPSYRVDLRDAPPDLFRDVSATDWRTLSWRRVRRPYRVEKWSRDKIEWERANGQPLPVLEGWKRFNARFHELFATEVPAAQARARTELLTALGALDVHGAREALEELLHLAIWNKIHRVEDAVWDPRGKRALFEDLGVDRPRILFLGCAEGYEAMQLLAMYPGGHAVLVDYDDFCRDVRWGEFPAAYPFLGVDPATGHRRVWYKDEMSMEFVVADIRDLDYGAEFDIVLSVGLIEHFPDEYKPLAFEFHRRFVKPGGWIVMTTPRDQLRSRAYYNVMSDRLNFGYRELMDVWQMGLYATENGLDVRRAGVIKAHNGLIARVRAARSSRGNSAMPLDFRLIYDSVRGLGAAFLAWLPRLFAALLLFVVAVFAARAVSWAARRAVRGRAVFRRNLQVAIGRLAYASALAIGLLLAATVAFPTFTIGSLIQLLGVSGVVIGFAFKDIFQNFLAGILLLLTNPFEVGDQIIVDTFEGTIEEIQTRATLITTYDRRRVLVPNADLFTKSVTVNTAYERRRMRYDVSIKGSDDVAQVKQALERAVRGGIEGVEQDPVATALLLSIAGGVLTFRVLWWSGSERGEYLIVQDRVLAAIYKALREAQLTTA